MNLKESSDETETALIDLKSKFAQSGINSGNDFLSIISGNAIDVLDNDNIGCLYVNKLTSIHAVVLRKKSFFPYMRIRPISQGLSVTI